MYVTTSVWPSESSSDRNSLIGTVFFPPTLMPRRRATYVPTSTIVAQPRDTLALDVTRRRSRALWAAGAVIVVAVAAGAWLLATRENTTPASIEDALARYRAQAEEAKTPVPPGVYVYATTGSESISARRQEARVPQRSTVTVTGGGCGMTLRWDVLEHRSNVSRSATTAAASGLDGDPPLVGQDDDEVALRGGCLAARSGRPTPRRESLHEQTAPRTAR
jgi:hypothetical protein